METTNALSQYRYRIMEKLEKSKRTGKFTLSPGQDIYGEITLDGSSSNLYLQDSGQFDPHAIPDRCVKGVLYDLTKVTLVDCIVTSGLGSARKGEERYWFATIFPHFVVYGDRHLSPTEKTITEVHFVVDDATTLFYDFDAFGSVIDARPFIEQIAHANANALNREIRTGPYPEILYFTGKTEIFAADTVLGRVSAYHNPIHSFPGPDGIRLQNTIVVTIAFKEPVAFEDAISHTATLVRYLGLLVGRPQALLELGVCTQSDSIVPPLEVYWCMPPKRKPSHEESKPHPSDVLLDGAGRPEEFSSVLADWLQRQQAWNDARQRFFDCFAEQQRYGIDRLIGAANMFDILPGSALPPDVQLSPAVSEAKEAARRIFRPLAPSPERDSVLNILGRIGKCTLKHKVRHRAQRLLAAVGERFPDLMTVTDEAINCRNYYVHGGDPRFDYAGNFNAVVFFTNTLEFVFAASDLIEAGWDVTRWIKNATPMSHPFAQFRVDYAERLERLKVLLS